MERYHKAMVNHCVQEFKKRQKKDVSKNARAMGRLKVACEKAKRDMATTFQTSIEVDCLYEGTGFTIKFTRAKFEELNVGFFKKCIEHVESCLRDGNMHKNNVDDIVLVGGSTRIPKAEAVAFGAAVLDANLTGNGDKNVKDLILLDVTPLSLGISIHDDVLGAYTMSVLIPRNTPIPTKKQDDYVTGIDNQATITISVYQGESNKIKDNIFLDEFTLHGVPPDRAGEQKVLPAAADVGLYLAKWQSRPIHHKMGSLGQPFGFNGSRENKGNGSKMDPSLVR
ncbi:heat shock 70 kDa protein 3-like [Rutidosis leptorrhynchoides]|uniref:heat shock 70 kDa protein 3-like n=1 Tax=Rutidosis leptorrhynchoides TaxID=125765 RepID=UPI003A9A265D